MADKKAPDSDNKPTRRRFMSTVARRAAEVGGLIAATGAGTIIENNDFTPTPQHPSYDDALNKVDPSRPIGILMFSVKAEGEDWGMKEVIYASRNTFKQAMHQHYQDNVIVIDNASMPELMEFSKQFNEKYGALKPEVHFFANHHQNTYDDDELAAFFKSIQGRNKRASILACGPSSEAYKRAGCDYVIVPRADGQILGPEVSFQISPAYRRAIGWMHDNADAEAIRALIAADRNPVDDMRDKTATWAYYEVVAGKPPPAYAPPVVVTPHDVTPVASPPGIIPK